MSSFGGFVGLISGLYFANQRLIARHQLCMLWGLGLLAAGGGSYFLEQWTLGTTLPANPGAYGLLNSILAGLTVTALATGGLAYWSMREQAWSLHRRAGMLTVFAGSTAALVHLCLRVMALWMN